ncbi:hypothetical protein ACVWW7_004668 [Bradyrhizobium sp. LM6.9]
MDSTANGMSDACWNERDVRPTPSTHVHSAAVQSCWIGALRGESRRICRDRACCRVALMDEESRMMHERNRHEMQINGPLKISLFQTRSPEVDDIESMTLQELRSAIGGGRVLEITTTTGCIVRCSYCPQDKFAERQRAISDVKHLSLQDFKRCLARVPAAVDISFSGYSEPWLNPACTEMVEHAYACGHGIRISTTLVGMNGRDLRRLRALQFRVFLVHVFDDGTHMDSGLVRRNYVDLVRQLVDADVSSLLFMVMGEVHPELIGIIPDEALVRSRPPPQQGWQRREDGWSAAANRWSTDMS